jgi:predicted O-methyltransferase YrrM
LAALLRLVVARQALRVCEIGTAAGGTTCALARASRPDALIATIDNALPMSRRMACQQMARSAQRIVCIDGNSHAPATLQRVVATLGDGGWDVLLIDGDHALSGVEKDFELYAPKVRSGGLIVLHDILPDARRRYGIDASGDSGDVPEFWTTLKKRYPQAREVVADPDQDGCGLGIIEP